MWEIVQAGSGLPVLFRVFAEKSARKYKKNTCSENTFVLSFRYKLINYLRQDTGN